MESIQTGFLILSRGKSARIIFSIAEGQEAVREQITLFATYRTISHFAGNCPIRVWLEWCFP